MNTQTEYDIIVYVNEEKDDVHYQANSPEGLAFILSPKMLQMMLTPEEFIAGIPPNLKVGVVKPGGNKVHKMVPAPLH
jgi:hypothetical protein